MPKKITAPEGTYSDRIHNDKAGTMVLKSKPCTERITSRQLLTALSELTNEELDLPIHFVVDNNHPRVSMLVSYDKQDPHITIVGAYRVEKNVIPVVRFLK